MARNVRNFWVKLEVDGRKSTIGAGPSRKDGGFSMRIFQRKAGQIWEALNLYGESDGNGNLTLTIVQGDGVPPVKIVTVR